MNKIVGAIASTLLADTASASVPLFAAKCPNGITADTDTKGRVYVDIIPQGNQPPRVTATGKDKSFAECEIVSFKAPDRSRQRCEQRRPASERAGQGRFDARGPVDCAERPGQPMRQCQADGNMNFRG